MLEWQSPKHAAKQFVESQPKITEDIEIHAANNGIYSIREGLNFRSHKRHADTKQTLDASQKRISIIKVL
jgi:hypothetical protein